MHPREELGRRWLGAVVLPRTCFEELGAVPEAVDRPDRCYFYERCALRLPVCAGGYPDEVCVSPSHTASCYRCGTGGEEK